MDGFQRQFGVMKEMLREMGQLHKETEKTIQKIKSLDRQIEELQWLQAELALQAAIAVCDQALAECFHYSEEVFV